MHKGADDHVLHNAPISTAPDADVGDPGREDDLIGVRHSVGRPVGHVNAERLEGLDGQ